MMKVGALNLLGFAMVIAPITIATMQDDRIGEDYYRYEFFGPEHVELCGDVEGLEVLDLGCGTGYFAREMARRGARVTAVDLSPKMLAHARRLESEDPLGIRYVESDAAAISPERKIPQTTDM